MINRLSEWAVVWGVRLLAQSVSERITRFRRVCLNREKRLLATSCWSVLPSVCLAVCPHVSSWPPTEQIYVKCLMLETFMKIRRPNPNLVKIGHFTRIPACVWMSPVTLTCHTSALFEWNGVRLLGMPRMYKYCINAPPCYIVLLCCWWMAVWLYLYGSHPVVFTTETLYVTRFIYYFQCLTVHHMFRSNSGLHQVH